MKCFYHSADLDGHCSGAIVKHFNPECELIGINYGDKFPWETIGRETVYMVDFSLQPFKDMVKLYKTCNLIWIDHHISAMREYKNHGFMEEDIGGFRCDGIGACKLVWEYFTDKPTPYSIQLLAEYDVWNHEDPNTLPFQYGMRQYETFPSKNFDFWGDLFKDDGSIENKIINEGRLILKYADSENKKYCSACAFETNLDGLKCIAVNKMLTNSKVFDSVWDNAKYDAMLTFGWRKGSWTISLYTDKPDVDVSAIAKNRGGGGHKQAAGFQCKEIPFKL